MNNEILIEEFTDSRIGLTMKKSLGYMNSDRAILTEESGHIIVIGKYYADELLQHRIPEEIEEKLISRMFIKNNGVLGSERLGCELEIKPEFFILDLTRRCNMHCKYCLRNVTDLDISINSKTIVDICKYIADYCNRYQLKDITIQPWGGEPLMKLESILLMKNVLSNLETNVHFSIETNALLLNEQTIETLYENKIGIGISIDGYQELHDAQRVDKNGLGTHSVVEHNLLNAQKKYGDRLGTITTVTRINAKKIDEILEYYAVDLGLKNVKFNYVHESMFSECKELCLTKEEIAETEKHLLKKIVELNRRGYRISEHNISVKLKNILLRRYTDICHSCGCSGGRKMIAFDMHGNFYPCELTDIPNEKIGSIYEGKDLIDLLKNSAKSKDFFIDKKSKLCEECMWYVFCRGGCTVRTISIGKRPPEIDEIECTVNTSLYPELMKLILEDPCVVNKLIYMNVCKFG